MRHEDGVGKTEGGKAGYGENYESEAAEGERVDTDQEHTRYGFYSTGCASAPLRSGQLHRLGGRIYRPSSDRAKLRFCFASTYSGSRRSAVS